MKTRKEIGNVDAALEELGPYGRYSLVQFSLQVVAQIAVVHHMFSIVFTGQKNPFQCPVTVSRNISGQGDNGGLNKTGISVSNTNWTASKDVCHSGPHVVNLDGISWNSSCDAYNVEYQLPKDRYFVSEFDLVCDREYLAALTQTLLTLGQAVASLVCPFFADNYGRKPTLMLCSFVWLGSSLGLAFSVNYTMFAVFKTLNGICLQGVFQTTMTVMIETLTSRQRGFMFGCLGAVFGTLSILLMVPVAYLMRNYSWRLLELAYCSYFIYIILNVFFMDESFRWLAANGMHKRAMFVLNRASLWNGCNLDKVVSAFYKDDVQITFKPISEHYTEMVNVTKINNKLIDNTTDEFTINHDDDSNICKENLDDNFSVEENLNFFSLFRNRQLRFFTAFCTLAWFFNNLTYFALFLMSSALSGSLYLNYSLNCFVELPAALFIYFYIDKLGRKICLASFNIIAGISLVGVAITAAISDQESEVIKVLAIIGKFGVSGSFAVLFTITSELFPTNIRNTAQGLASLSACVGGMLAPFSELLMSKVVYAPGLIFGTGSLVLGALTFFLPETANRQLPQSVKDIENWSHDNEPTKEKRFCHYMCHR
uniref:Major facilitator superfamily (MFS) profile domain-containing protein n=1 Tax=Arion vulgaris TaxID=1028688 RepID=A0A0B7ATE4_9EUPU